MFYLGIDQHARQLTNSLRDEQDVVVQTRQVSTHPSSIQEICAVEMRVHPGRRIIPGGGGGLRLQRLAAAGAG